MSERKRNKAGMDHVAGDCTDPQTGLLLMLEDGEVTMPCPQCGTDNTVHPKMTNRFQFRCSKCGQEWVAATTLTPANEHGGGSVQ
jgi:predicted RNA-binding Zn-ribbon protein involved in translation (DUF1610 family)